MHRLTSHLMAAGHLGNRHTLVHHLKYRGHPSEKCHPPTEADPSSMNRNSTAAPAGWARDATALAAVTRTPKRRHPAA